MWQQTVRPAKPVLLGILLVVIGGVLGNVVTDLLPAAIVAFDRLGRDQEVVGTADTGSRVASSTQ